MLDIKVLGPGCANCTNLEKLCRDVVTGLAIDAEVEKVTDYREIMSYGIMNTPALVINGKVIHSGKLPTRTTLSHWISNALAESETK